MLNHKEAAFIPREFENLKFNVMAIPKEDNVLKHFPELSTWDFFTREEEPAYIERIPGEGNSDPSKTFRYPVNRSKAFRFVCLAYDKESPIWKKWMDNEKKRKTWAAYYAGWEPGEDGFFEKAVDQMMHCNILEVNDLMIDFIQTFGDPAYAFIAVAFDSYFKSLRTIQRANVDIDDPVKAVQNENIKNTLLKNSQGSMHNLTKEVDIYLRDSNTSLKANLFNVNDKNKARQQPLTVERQMGIHKYDDADS